VIRTSALEMIKSIVGKKNVEYCTLIIKVKQLRITDQTSRWFMTKIHCC